MNPFEFLNRPLCKIVGHDCYHDFMKEGKVISENKFMAKKILEGTVKVCTCYRCGRSAFKDRLR